MIFEVSEGSKITIFDVPKRRRRRRTRYGRSDRRNIVKKTILAPTRASDGPHGGPKSAPEASRGPSGHRIWEVWKRLWDVFGVQSRIVDFPKIIVLLWRGHHFRRVGGLGDHHFRRSKASKKASDEIWALGQEKIR